MTRKKEGSIGIVVPSVPKLPKGKHSKNEKQQDLVFPRPQASQAELKELLRSLRLKVTQQRLSILQALHQGASHVQVHDVLEIVRMDDPSIGFATVYRLLKKMAQTGHVTEVRTGSQPTRYEMTPTRHHDHLTCVQCGRICEFESGEIESLQIQVAEKLGFRLTGHLLELHGVCAACDRRETEAKTKRR